MKQVLFFIIGALMVLPSLADNRTTTRSYVDYNVGTKQDKIPGLPAGYTPLEYIESTGTQYIDTGVVLGDVASEVYVDFQKTDDTMNTSLMGCQVNDSVAGYNGNLRQTYYFYNDKFRFYNSDQSHANIILSTNLTDRHKIKVTADDHNLITVNIDGTVSTYNTQPYENLPQNTQSLYLFANHIGTGPSQKIKARIYEVYIKNSSGRMVFYGIPAKNSSNIIGMYDAISNRFLTNIGNGTFNAGPVAIGRMLTYGTDAGDIRSTPIVNAIGTDTTSTTVPTSLAVSNKLNTLMNKVSAAAGYVMTGENRGQTHFAKPIYDTSTRNFIDALIYANTLNTAATRAANSETFCIDTNCTLLGLNTSGISGVSITCKGADVPCLANSECCSGRCDVLNNGTCVGGCAGVKDTCGKDGIVCCAGNFCGDGECTACHADFEQCKADIECCSGICYSISGKKPTCVSGCALDGAECKRDSDCCSKNCYNGQCVSYGCKRDTITCTANTDCCSGNCFLGYCQPAGCAISGNVCTSNSDCCNNVCNQSSHVCDNCKAPGESVTDALQCCSTIAVGGTCSCRGNGSRCANDAECCGNLVCSKGECAASSFISDTI
jgi:hypothetical protein